MTEENKDTKLKQPSSYYSDHSKPRDVPSGSKYEEYRISGKGENSELQR